MLFWYKAFVHQKLKLIDFLIDVLIVNRYEYYERLTNFDVRVGVSTDNLQNPTCHDRVGTVGQGQFLNVQCDPPIPGRYVSVQMFGEGILTLCEVFVYSRVGEWIYLYIFILSYFFIFFMHCAIIREFYLFQFFLIFTRKQNWTQCFSHCIKRKDDFTSVC